jgi:hypothetical protein
LLVTIAVQTKFFLSHRSLGLENHSSVHVLWGEW